MLFLLIAFIGIVGEVKCAYKMFNCNWNPIGRAEVLYTVGTCTGLGMVIGYINIKDY